MRLCCKLQKRVALSSPAVKDYASKMGENIF
jgi:hypothetical protein